MELTEKLVKELKRIKHLGKDVKIHRAYLSPDRSDVLFATDDMLLRVEVSALSPEMAQEVLKPMVMIETKPLPEMTTLTEPRPLELDEELPEVKTGSNPVQPEIIREEPKIRRARRRGV